MQSKWIQCNFTSGFLRIFDSVSIGLRSFDWLVFRGLTFINTDSLSFSLLIIFIATFFPSTQWTPNFTSPMRGEEEKDKKD